MTRTRPPAIHLLANRVVVLQGVRLLAAAALVAIPALAGSFEMALVPLAVSYAFVIGMVELTRRRVRRFDPRLVSSAVLVDGLVLAVAVARTGGARSPLLFLGFLLVVATTLLVSYRTGLQLATWWAFLLVLGQAAADAGVVDRGPVAGDRVSLVSAATFLVFAVGVAAFAWVNERSLLHSRAQLEWLVEFSTDLDRMHRADDAMAALLRHSCGRLGFTRAVVLIRRGDDWRGVCDDGIAESLIELRHALTLPALETLSGCAPLLVRTLEEEALDSLLPYARNVVIVPVVADDDRFGILAAEWGGGGDAKIPVRTVQGLAQAATHTAATLRNAALLEEVERLATRDSLTGIANRRLFDESIAREVARAQRTRAPLSLIVFDVDRFKNVNDTYGHLIGDVVLRDVAESIVASAKSFDVAARYGGDEFMLLLPDCGSTDAEHVAERVRAEIARRVRTTPVTVSVGLATMPDNAIGADRLISAADAALYQAKRSGRDRAVRSMRAAEQISPPAARLNDPPIARGA